MQDDDFGLVRNLSESIRQTFRLVKRIEPPVEIDYSFELCRLIGLALAMRPVAPLGP